MTPLVFQNVFSAPQKQPNANSAISLPSGYGGRSAVPSTSCAAGTAITPARPGSGSTELIMRVFCVPKVRAASVHDLSCSFFALAAYWP